MDITLEKLQYADAEELYEFELKNREYFEEMVPSRGDDYYNFESFIMRQKALLDEQAKGLSYFNLIKDDNGLILGRMNLIDIDKSLNLAHIGYRVGEEHTGKGIANQALRLLLKNIDKQGVKQLLAKTTTNNIASQKVLEKNGFKRILTGDEEFEMNGIRLKFVYYEWTNKESY